MTFFAISGYALSWKPLSLIQKDQLVKTYQSLASSIFRRHPRLFIPALVICVPSPLIAYLGGYSGGEAMPGTAIMPTNPPRFDSVWAQFADYLKAILGISDVYGPSGLYLAYSDSFWTLPMEFKGSMVVFSMLVALSRCTTRARVVIAMGVAIYSLWYFHWGEFLFVGGMLVVDASLRSQRSASARGLRLDGVEHDVQVQAHGRSSHWPALLRTRAFRRSCSIVAFLGALFLLSMPEQGRGAANSWGFKTLVWLIPTRFHASGAADHFWQPLAAVFLVVVIDRTRFLQRIFTTRFAQYLGRVSFALYLVHMLILHSLGFWLGKYFVALTGSETYWQYGTGVGAAALVVGGVIVWVADLGSRFVDEKAVRFTAWAYSSLCKTTTEE
jgi:peptidoglycan/LPS O-acetylase OafA/YrhL